MGAATGLPYGTVANYVLRAQRAGLSWPLPDGLGDEELEHRLFRQPARPTSLAPRPA